MEEWRVVEGYEGCYEVSSHGNIRSVERESLSYGTRMCKRKSRVLRPNCAGRYATVTLSKEGIIKTHSVHRLVCSAFHPNPSNLPQVDHIDRNPFNNHYLNLHWVESFENMANRGTPIHNTSGEIHIRQLPSGRWKFHLVRGYIHTQKTFKTLDEAKAYRLEILGF